ncbi:MAG: septal ring lytic transglycosylase RlpA family protein [Acidobacteria bacterium]|nr:septal ring lytic transglycosylase RlpA family protein [Acidobacteriota bacterium]
MRGKRMRRRLAESLAVLLSVASLGAGAASGPNSSEAAKVANKPTVIQPVSRRSKPIKNSPYEVGTASWYGDYFQGKATASGEPFDMQAMTAAHPTLPLGSFVRVTNLRNGRAVVVRINDRGPVVEGRIIDVSYNTARVLGFEGRGIQKVRLDLVKPVAVARLQTVASLQ